MNTDLNIDNIIIAEIPFLADNLKYRPTLNLKNFNVRDVLKVDDNNCYLRCIG